MDPDNSPETIADPVISVRDLSKTYERGDDTIRAVDDVSFDVDPGTVVGILGPNGAGKTSIIKMMLGLITPTAGEIRIAGTDVFSGSTKIYQHVGAMLEGARNVYWRLTVRENLEFFASLNGINPKRASGYHDDLVTRYGLEEEADEPVRDLSRGMKQKVALICTLARQTDVIFLDEPTLGLDVETSLDLRREIRRLAEEKSLTVVLSSHDMDHVPDGPLPDPETPASPRFLPEFDNAMLSHADRTRIVPTEYRRRFVDKRVRKGSVLVDGFFAGFWSLRTDRDDEVALIVEPFDPLAAETRAALSEEGERLLAFVSDGDSGGVQFAAPG